MDILDIFLNKYSYKFPKGYPDMNNEQDVLLMESLLNELGVNLTENSLSKSELEKQYPPRNEFADKYSDRGERFLEKILNSSEFELKDGSTIKIDPKASSELVNALEKKQYDILSKGAKVIIDTNGKSYGISSFKKTEEFGGETSARGEKIEAQELAYVNILIEKNGGKIDIILGDKVGDEYVNNKVYYNITKAQKVTPKNKQADFEFIGNKGNNLYIQHKNIISQQLSGVHKLNLLDVEENLLNVKELTDDELKIVVKKYPEIQKFVEDVKTKRPDGLTNGDNISKLISPELQIKAAYGIGNEFGPNKVQAVFFGPLTLESEQLDNGEDVFRLSSPNYFVFPKRLDDDYEVMITATFRNNMKQQGIKNARFGFYPKKVYSKTTMIPQKDVDINVDSETP